MVNVRRWTKRILIGLCALIVLAAVAGAAYQWLATRRDLAATPPPGQLIDVGGHRLHLWCTGEGTPSVILDTGLSGSTADWGFVQPEVARFTRVCAYDRAGRGYSDPGPSPRTSRRIARELAVLLERSALGRPFVLVGASSGGFNMRVFASEHGEGVAGLVLVDASHEDQAHEVPGLAPLVPYLAFIGGFRLLGVTFGPNPDSLAPPVRGFARAVSFRTAGYQTSAEEMIHIRESAAEVRASRHELTFPVVVLTGGRGADATWRDLQRDQARLSKRGCQIVVEESGHRVAVDQPRIVVDAIRAIVDASRAESNGPVCAKVGG